MIKKFIKSFASLSWASSQLCHDVHLLNTSTAAAAGNDYIITSYTRPVWIREFCDAPSFMGDGFTGGISMQQQCIPPKSN